MVPVKVWGPAYDMSMTSKGYFLEVLHTGKYMRSTVVVVPKAAPTMQDLNEDRNAGEAEDDYSPSLLAEDITGQEQPEDNVANDGIVELDLGEVNHGDQGLPVHDRPATRVHGKQPPRRDQAMPSEPTLRRLQGGGEWRWVEEARREDKEEEWWMWEHIGLVQWIKEESNILQDVETMQVVVEAQRIVEELEEKLKNKAKMRKTELKRREEEQEEVLQTRVVSQDEVRRDLQAWIPAFEEEYKSLTSGPVTPIFDEDIRRMKEEGRQVEVLPAKAIASRKPPNRRKARVVVRGNFAEEKSEEHTSVGGVCAMAIRGITHIAARKGWRMGSLDVKGAFLQAPRRQLVKVSVVDPPMDCQCQMAETLGLAWLHLFQKERGGYQCIGLELKLCL